MLEERAPSVKFKGNCYKCGESGHKKSVCIKAKKINAVSKYSVVRDLPIVEAKVQHEGGDKDVKVLFDTSSNLTTLANKNLVS
jgi:hypothetical protein